MKEQVLMQNGFCEMSNDEMMELDGGMSPVQAGTATLGIGCLAWALPIAMVNPVAGAGVLLVGAGLTINSFS